MSKEAEEFFRQNTIENAKRPRMKKFLALVDREEEGKIMQEYTDKQLLLYSVSQQRELLIAFHKWQQKMWTNPNSEITENVVDVYLKSNL